MPVFAINMTHPPESCPSFNEKVNKRFTKQFKNKDKIASNEKLTVLSACFSPLEHMIFYVVEAPSHQAVVNFLKNVGYASYNKVEIRQVRYGKTIEKLIKQNE
jgi:saccharopine dehydrogenase-like NADP-dependent oxidoreductase